MPAQTNNALKISLTVVSKYGTLIAMAAMIALFWALSPRHSFLSMTNVLAVVNQSAMTAIIASALTLVLVVGEFDLSVGYHASLAGVLCTGMIVRSGFPIPVAIAAMLAIGAVIGLVNGLLVTKAKVNAVVATLGVGTMLVGLTYGYTQGSPITSVPAEFKQITLGRTLGVQNPIWIMLIVLALLWVLLNRTALGQRIQAVGANQEAARLAGVRVDRTKNIAFGIAGCGAALAGLMLASFLGSGTQSAADGYLMDSFAAVFLGSATLRDGSFHIVGTLVGVLIVNIGFNGLSLLGTPVFWQYIFKGGILVLAVALSSIARQAAKEV
ncbi:MAG: ABC transporter permease [Propionibacteriaceae bacterium]|jgi:ribose transport system permease protein|nr:ABC transporter permease [Propionibacteriaceae bacterium]